MIFVFYYNLCPVVCISNFFKIPFSALIHPIQRTIALPVGAAGPTKCQKKTFCIYYWQDRSQSVHSLGGASYFLPV